MNLGLSDVLAVIGVGIAVWAVIVAHRANVRAKEANQIAERTLPPEWSGLEPTPDDKQFKVRNQSSRAMVVESVELTSGNGKVWIDYDFPVAVNYGDALVITVLLVYEEAQPHLRIGWRYADEPRDFERVTDRLIP